MRKSLHFLLIILITFFFSSTYADITICSFNIQFLGSSMIRDNKSLTELLKEYDIVVVQELVAPPYLGKFPDGSNYKPDKESAEFFDLMWKNNFRYILSEEDTGPGKTNHSNANGTEWWVVFYKADIIKVADDLPWGFLEKDRTANKNYDRVPYAFPFRTADKKLDFVLISVHLHPADGLKNKSKRAKELSLIYKWIDKNDSKEKDFIILGDMNIEDKEELDDLELKNYLSLNSDCQRTNTLINRNVDHGAKPYDHVKYNTLYTTNDIDMNFGFKVIDLIKTMKPYWKKSSKYPGDPYNHNLFRQYYSDHHPVVFKMKDGIKDDD